jgi:hypothetical protein
MQVLASEPETIFLENPMSQDLSVYVDRIDIFDDHDGWWTGAGDIYINYDVNDGAGPGVDGTLGEYSIDSGDGRIIGEQIAVLNNVDNFISINFSVWDSDVGDDDHLDYDMYESYSSDQNFGIGTHTYQTDDYSLVYSIAEV